MTDMQPVQLAVKYDPPKLALVYNRGRENFVHEFPISSRELKNTSQEIFKILSQNHPGYLNNIQQDQVIRLIDMIRQYHTTPSNSKLSKPSGLKDLLNLKPNLASFNKHIDEMDLYSPRSGDSYDDGYYQDRAQLDFAQLDRDIANESYDSYGAESDKSEDFF